MNNITQLSTYKFEIKFDYPDPYNHEVNYLPFEMNHEITIDSLAAAWIVMEARWKEKYDLVQIGKADIKLTITPVENLPPAA